MVNPTRLRGDVVANYAGLAVLAVSGILLNFLIVWGWDSETLGAFNQVVAAYLVISLLATAGVHTSALRAAAAHKDDSVALARLTTGALIPAFGLSAAVAGGFYLSAETFAAITESASVGAGIEHIALGLFLFSLNKILIGVINGMEHMRMFALIQGMRGAFLIASVLALWGLGTPGSTLPIVFTFTEGALFVVTLGYVSYHVHFWRVGPGGWIARHLQFGIKNFASGMLVELNARIDVLMLGAFYGDRLVGIYSFAALFAEGFFQLIVVLQNVFHPKLAAASARADRPELEAVIAKGRRLTYRITLAAAPIAALGFPLAILLAGPEVDGSWVPFVILIGGMTAASGVLTFQNLLAMANLPGWHTIFMTCAVGLNVALNAILIPLYGLTGAASATAIALIAGAIMLIVLARRLVGVRLL